MIINKSLQLILASRSSIIQLVQPLTTDQLNRIPDGMNNNIIWNMAHLIAVQQDRCYLQAGIEAHASDSLIANYKYGTKPAEKVDDQFYNSIKQQLVQHIEVAAEDYAQDKFRNFLPFNSRLYPGLEISTIEEAFQFIVLHEGLHQGYIRQIVKLIS
jgi:hypothetical protein